MASYSMRDCFNEALKPSQTGKKIKPNKDTLVDHGKQRTRMYGKERKKEKKKVGLMYKKEKKSI